MIVAPNTQGQKYWVGIVRWAPEISVSEEIADIFRNYDIKWILQNYFNCYPTLAREFQGLRVWGKFVFRTLELTDTPTNLANQVKEGHALD